MYPISIDNDFASWAACINFSLNFSTSTTSSSSANRIPSDNAEFKIILASIGLISSFPNNAANLADIGSPFFTGVVSLRIQIVPWSILVGILFSLNSVSIGPGAIPVFFGGTTTSMLAISPPLAVSSTLFLPSRTFSLNGDIFVNIKTHWPVSFSFIFSMPGISNFSRDFFATLSLMLTISTSPRSFFLKGNNWDARTFSNRTSAVTLYFFGRSCRSWYICAFFFGYVVLFSCILFLHLFYPNRLSHGCFKHNFFNVLASIR